MKKPLIFALLPILCWAGEAMQNKPTDQLWQNTPFWCGSETWCRIGTHWMHPGNNSDVQRVFVAPQDGRVTITGTVKKLHLDGDGVVASILLNAKTLWTAELEGKDGLGKAHDVTCDVKQGDKLVFRVNRRNSYSCDTTGWDPCVAFQCGSTYQASAAFGSVQGPIWFYEEQRDEPVPPVRYGISVDFLLKKREAVTSDDLPLVLDERGFIVEGDLTDTRVQAAYQRVTAGLRTIPELELLLLCVADWQLAPVFAARCTSHAKGAVPSTVTNEPLPDVSVPVRRRLEQRAAFLSNPLLQFWELLFSTRKNPSWNHEVAQYFGWRQRPGGSLYRLKRPGLSLERLDLIKGQLPAGSFLEPRLSYDAKKILFSYVQTEGSQDPRSLPRNETDTNHHYFHIYEMGVDGTGLKQLTNDSFDDLHPEFLPDGGIAFVSTRRRASSRCFWWGYSDRWHSYTVFRMYADGSGIQQLSWNDVNDWFPAVANSGHLLFARWDYIDRDAVTHQNLWSMRPDGTNPMAVWGNETPEPQCTFQAKAIPNSTKIVCIASAHHSITAGPVILIDPSVDNNSPAAITRITPGTYPETGSWRWQKNKPWEAWYNSPWPLSEHLFIVAYSPDGLLYEPSDHNPDGALGLYVIDDQGHRELLYRERDIGATCPIPLQPRAVPPILPSNLDARLAEQGKGEVFIRDIYEGLPKAERGTIQKIRVVQVFPKTTRDANVPRIGVAGEENARMVLGEADVCADGSVRFFVPSGKPIYFQCIDREGFAYQTMRSSTSLMPGERVSCVGCHENKMTVNAKQNTLVEAMKRPAVDLMPTPESGRPYGFVEHVQPVIDKYCVSCHQDEQPRGGFSLTRTPMEAHVASYQNLCYAKDKAGKWVRRLSSRTGKPLVPCYPQRNQIQVTPEGGEVGARGSGLIAAFRRQEGITADELRAVGVWLDLNAIFYGVYEPESDLQRQRAGLAVAIPQIQ